MIATHFVSHNRRTSNNHLFLGVGGLLVLVLLALLAGTLVALLRASLAERSVSVLGGLVIRNLALLDLVDVGDGEGRLVVLDLAVVRVVADLLGGVDLVLGRIASLGLLAVAREDNETLLVGLQAGDVGLERLLGDVLAAGVDSDADGGRKLARDASLLLSIPSDHILHAFP